MTKKTDVIFPIRNEKSIALKEYEIALLEQIMIHRIMHSKSIHLFLNILAAKKLNSNAISNRLKRLVDAKILDRTTINISLTRAEFPRYYYKIGLRAYRLLVKTNRIEHTKDNFKTFKLSRKSEIPSIHTDAMSILANQIYLECISNSIYNFTHMRGVEGELVTKDGRKIGLRGLNLAIPDWIFLQGKEFIFVELDTGSQNQQMIRDKIDKYAKLYGSFLEKNGYTMTIVFAVLDDSIDVVQKNKKKNRAKRVASIKQNLSSPIISYEKNIFVVSANRAPYLIKNILRNDNLKESALILDWLNNAERIISTQKNLIVEQNHIDQKDDDDGGLSSFLKLSTNQKSQLLIPIIASEGNLFKYRLINFANKRMSGFTENSDMVLVLVYLSSEEAEQDVFGMEIVSKIYKTSLTTWQQANKIPQMIKITGPYTQE